MTLSVPPTNHSNSPLNFPQPFTFSSTMEALGAFSDAQWDSFTAFFSSHDLHLDHSLLPFAANAASTDLQPTDHAGSAFLNTSWFYSLDAFDPTLHSAIKQDITCNSCSTDSSTSFVFANSSDMFMSMDDKSFGSSFFSDVLMEEVDKSLCAVDEDGRRERFENVQHCHPLPLPQVAGKKLIPSKRKQEEPKPVTEGDGKVNNSAFSDNQKKKTAQKNKKSTRQWKKTKNTRGVSVEEEGDGQSSISCSSEEENENGSQEGNGVSSTSSDGKTRASRGSATDPQSLYARKRREKINERLKMLQRLVPNGTKVDISTMLEEAVHYVKFLQLQIKLLSSDEMWMFAPLAYNGMDIGLLHHRLSPFLSN